MRSKASRGAIPYFFRLSHLYESDHGLCAEDHFRELLNLETKRAARSKTVSLLLLLDVAAFEEQSEGDRVLSNVTSVLFSSTREIDAKGWYQYPAVLGILVTDLIATSDALLSTRDAIVDRLRTDLAKALGSLVMGRIKFSCQILPSLLEASITYMFHSSCHREGRLVG